MSTAIKKAITQLERRESAEKTKRTKARAEGEKLTVSGLALGGALIGALVDEKFSEGPSEAYRYKGIPVNGALAAVGGAAALYRKTPARDAVLGVSTGLACVSLYQLVREKLTWDAAEEQPES